MGGREAAAGDLITRRRRRRAGGRVGGLSKATRSCPRGRFNRTKMEGHHPPPRPPPPPAGKRRRRRRSRRRKLNERAVKTQMTDNRGPCTYVYKYTKRIGARKMAAVAAAAACIFLFFYSLLLFLTSIHSLCISSCCLVDFSTLFTLVKTCLSILTLVACTASEQELSALETRKTPAPAPVRTQSRRPVTRDRPAGGRATFAV